MPFHVPSNNRIRRGRRGSGARVTDGGQSTRETLSGIASGMGGALAGAVGWPVDVVNMPLHAFGITPEHAVGGTRWFGNQLANIAPAVDPTTGSFTAGEFLAPDPFSKIGAAAKMAGLPLAGMTFFHGTPHKFDQFDASHIGKGEGAQAYGRGLYFAERPGIAVEYRNSITRAQKGGGYLPDEVQDMYDAPNRALEIVGQAREILRAFGEKGQGLDEVEDLFHRFIDNNYAPEIPKSLRPKDVKWGIEGSAPWNGYASVQLAHIFDLAKKDPMVADELLDPGVDDYSVILDRFMDWAQEQTGRPSFSVFEEGSSGVDPELAEEIVAAFWDKDYGWDHSALRDFMDDPNSLYDRMSIMPSEPDDNFLGFYESAEDAQKAWDEWYGTMERLRDRIDDSGNVPGLEGFATQPMPHARGYLYEVDIEDEALERFLDFDKQTNMQHPVVQEALRKLGVISKPKFSRDEVRSWIVETGHSNPDWKYHVVMPNGKEFPAAPNRSEALHAARPLYTEYAQIGPHGGLSVTGQNVYKGLVEQVMDENQWHGWQSEKRAQAVVSEKLRKLGVPGNIYNDGVTRRRSGKKTRNVVVFPGEENRIIKEVKRDGQSVWTRGQE